MDKNPIFMREVSSCVIHILDRHSDNTQFKNFLALSCAPVLFGFSGYDTDTLFGLTFDERSFLKHIVAPFRPTLRGESEILRLVSYTNHKARRDSETSVRIADLASKFTLAIQSYYGTWKTIQDVPSSQSSRWDDMTLQTRFTRIILAIVEACVICFWHSAWPELQAELAHLCIQTLLTVDKNTLFAKMVCLEIVPGIHTRIRSLYKRGPRPFYYFNVDKRRSIDVESPYTESLRWDKYSAHYTSMLQDIGIEYITRRRREREQQQEERGIVSTFLSHLDGGDHGKDMVESDEDEKIDETTSSDSDNE